MSAVFGANSSSASQWKSRTIGNEEFQKILRSKDASRSEWRDVAEYIVGSPMFALSCQKSLALTQNALLGLKFTRGPLATKAFELLLCQKVIKKNELIGIYPCLLENSQADAEQLMANQKILASDDCNDLDLNDPLTASPEEYRQRTAIFLDNQGRVKLPPYSDDSVFVLVDRPDSEQSLSSEIPSPSQLLPPKQQESNQFLAFADLLVEAPNRAIKAIETLGLFERILSELKQIHGRKAQDAYEFLEYKNVTKRSIHQIVQSSSHNFARLRKNSSPPQAFSIRRPKPF